MKVRVRRLPHGMDLPLPSYQTGQSAGMDLYAAVDGDLVLEPGQRAVIPAGLSLSVPEGFEAQVRPRSGLAIKHGISLVNAPGTVDSDYRGEVGIILINHGTGPFIIHRGDRIAQMVFTAVMRAEWIEVDSLDETERGTGGFGSTG